jgi:NADH dehydrogenase
MMSMRPRIAIVGANFAGLKAAQSFSRRYEVTVIDQSPWFEWLPNIHEIVSGVKRPSDLRLPRRRVVAAAGHRFLRATVAAIDPSAGCLRLADGRNFSFELCIVAVGGSHDTSAVPGAERFALPF